MFGTWKPDLLKTNNGKARILPKFSAAILNLIWWEYVQNSQIILANKECLSNCSHSLCASFKTNKASKLITVINSTVPCSPLYIVHNIHWVFSKFGKANHRKEMVFLGHI